MQQVQSKIEVRGRALIFVLTGYVSPKHAEIAQEVVEEVNLIIVEEHSDRFMDGLEVRGQIEIGTALILMLKVLPRQAVTSLLAQKIAMEILPKYMTAV